MSILMFFLKASGHQLNVNRCQVLALPGIETNFQVSSCCIGKSTVGADMQTEYFGLSIHKSTNPYSLNGWLLLGLRGKIVIML
ncbi:hypothetical protein D3C77_381010 [compost metagenome]